MVFPADQPAAPLQGSPTPSPRGFTACPGGMIVFRGAKDYRVLRTNKSY
jgi:hypothetical protein